MSRFQTPLSRQHRMRLMQIWRSAGWPCQDAVELELLAAGMVVRHVCAAGHEQLRLTDLAVGLLAAAREQGQRAASLHDRMAHRFAQQQLLPAGRIVWRELTLRAALDAVQDEGGGIAPHPAGGQDAHAMLFGDDATLPAPVVRAARRVWRVARPDLFSIRNTSVPGYLRPVVHEVKASRADLLSDLRHQVKRRAYQWLSEECCYVFPKGIAEPDELPEEYGVWAMHGDPDDPATCRFELLRSARHAPCALPFAVWMALCKATPERPDDDVRAQLQLGAADDDAG